MGAPRWFLIALYTSKLLFLALCCATHHVEPVELELSEAYKAKGDFIILTVVKVLGLNDLSSFMMRNLKFAPITLTQGFKVVGAFQFARGESSNFFIITSFLFSLLVRNDFYNFQIEDPIRTKVFNRFIKDLVLLGMWLLMKLEMKKLSLDYSNLNLKFGGMISYILEPFSEWWMYASKWMYAFRHYS